MEPRWIPAFVAAMGGCVTAVLAAVTGVAALAAVAAVCCLVAGFTSLRMLERVQHLERSAASADADAKAQTTRIAALEREVDVVRAELNEALAAQATIDEVDRVAVSVLDAVTGLPDERVFEVVFERKIASARRHLRPLTLLLADIPAAMDEAISGFGELVRKTLRDADIACRLDESRFALILDDTPEAGGVWTAERLQIAAAALRPELGPVAVGVATYPNSGLTAEEVLVRGTEALGRALLAAPDGLGPVEVARGDA